MPAMVFEEFAERSGRRMNVQITTYIFEDALCY